MAISLRWNKILLLVLILGGLNLGLYLLSNQVFLESYEELENQVAHDNLSRAFNVLYHDVDNLTSLALDYAEWDETYSFMESEADDYVESNLTENTLNHLQLDLVMLVGTDGETRYSELIDSALHIDAATGQSIETYLSQMAETLLAEGEEDPVAGLQHFNDQLYLVSLVPILTSQGLGPRHGTLVLARHVDEKYIMDISLRVRQKLGLEIWPAYKVKERLATQSSKAPGGNTLHFLAEEVTGDSVRGYAMLQDVDGHYGPVLTLVMPRVIYQQGRSTVQLFLIWSVVLGSLAAALVYFIMDRLAQSVQRRREEEERYRRLSTEFQAILDAIPDELTKVSAAREIVWGNSAAIARREHLPRDSQGRYLLTEAAREEDRSEMVEAAFSEGVPCEQVETDERGRQVFVKAIPLADSASDLSGVIKLTSDITEEVRLRQENEQAARLAALGEISAGMAHEINNPNGMIQMNLGLVADVWNDLEPILKQGAADDPELRLGGLSVERVLQELPELLQEMTQNTRRISGIVNDLKGFAGRDVTEGFTDVDLNVVATAAERMASNQIFQAGADYHKMLTVDLPSVAGNFRKLEQVVINLLLNACQALESSGAKLLLRTWYDMGAQEAVLVVEDAGCGIDPANLGRITNPFFTTRRETGGTGLGLSVSSRIVKEHNGQLLFRSTPGKGTVAELRLPCHEDKR